MMEFVKAAPEDQTEILALYRSLVGTEHCAWTQDYPNESTIQFDMERDALFCLKDEEGKIVGVISIDQDDEVEKLPCWTMDLQPAGELSRLGVRIESQNQGVAGELLKNGMKELKDRGKKSAHFLVCKTNEKAIRAYHKLDFNIVGECRLFGEEWWCYEKSLYSN